MRRVLSLCIAVIAYVFVVLGPHGVAMAQTPIEFSWRPAAFIKTASYYHTATMLPDQRVLITGGRQGYTPLQRMQIYDPVLNGGIGGWVDQPDMFNRRERHQATLMPAGWLLISGGLDNVPIKQCELYDPSTNMHLKLPDLLSARYEHTATYLPGSKVLAVGSKDYDRGLPTCEIFEILETAQGADPLWRWRPTGSLNFGRGKHRAVELKDGRIMVIGGVHNYRPTATCETFDRISETWTQVAPMWSAREGHTATVLHDGRVLVVGGDIGGAEISSCEIFDPYKNGGFGEWTKIASAKIERKNHTATLIKDRFLIVTGAWRTGQGERSTEIMDTWLANPQWHIGPEMLETRSNHSATLLADGRLLLVGGEVLGYQAATSACDISEKTLSVSILSPESYGIASIAPNPFSSSTSITVALPGGSYFNLVVSDNLGRIVRTIAEGAASDDSKSYLWDGNDELGRALPAGMYYIRLLSNSVSVLKSALLMR